MALSQGMNINDKDIMEEAWDFHKGISDVFPSHYVEMSRVEKLEKLASEDDVSSKLINISWNIRLSVRSRL